MYEYSNYQYDCGCGGDYREDSAALDRLARLSTDSEGNAHDCHDHGEGHDHSNCGERHCHADRVDRHPQNEGCAGQGGCRCSICGLVNRLRRTICGCGCGCRRDRRR